MSDNVCGILIKQIHDALEKTANNRLREIDLTFSQVQLLHIISASKSHTSTFKDLEHLMRLSQATTAGIIRRLEQKEFVECRADAVDKRTKHAKITTAGKEVLLKARGQMLADEQRILKGFTPGESAVLIEYLQKLRDNLR